MAYPVLVRTHKTSLVCQPAGPQRPTLPPAHAHHWDAVWPEETTCAHLNTAGDNIVTKEIKVVYVMKSNTECTRLSDGFPCSAI